MKNALTKAIVSSFWRQFFVCRIFHTSVQWRRLMFFGQCDEASFSTIDITTRIYLRKIRNYCYILHIVNTKAKFLVFVMIHERWTQIKKRFTMHYGLAPFSYLWYAKPNNRRLPDNKCCAMKVIHCFGHLPWEKFSANLAWWIVFGCFYVYLSCYQMIWRWLLATAHLIMEIETIIICIWLHERRHKLLLFIIVLTKIKKCIFSVLHAKWFQ